MIVALISTFMQALADIFWKKSLSYGVGGKIHDLLSYPIGVAMAIYFLSYGIDGSVFDLTIVVVVFVVMLVAIFRTQFYQKIYNEEKISVIMPYTNINKIVIIICSFFLFSDVSVISLFITIIAIIVIILFSIDFKNHTVPKNTTSLIVLEILRAIDVLVSGWIILNYTEIHYFIVVVVWGIIILMTLSFAGKQFKTIRGKPKEFWVSRYIGGLGWIAWFLALVIIKDLGLSISILLSFLGIGITLLLSYIILGDKPSKKDLLLTLIVTILVGLGFYFK
ncbi:hypothetical protein MK079_04640 [Candidatus Gracilibacteria bacterium]|nr:hypothetical protein [Candidatus Gracilibacteria bacterium]